MAVYKALDIARWFISRNLITFYEQGGEPITLLKVLKLLYYSEGCSLALDNGSLFLEDIYAWRHGPVVKEVYNFYDKDPYNLPFGTDEDEAAVETIDSNPCDSNILEQVFNEFGQYSAWALRDQTHKEEPWIEATNNGEVMNRIINRETMKRYFAENYVS